MANITVLMTDMQNGTTSTSINLSEDDMQRIAGALKSEYKTLFDHPPTSKEVYYTLARNMLQSILDSVFDIELQIKFNEVKQKMVPFSGEFSG